MRDRGARQVIAALVVVLLLALLSAGTMGGPGMMYGYGFWWWGIIMMLFWVLVIVGGIWLVVSLLRQGRPAEVGPGPGRERPLDILRERYARGEITREQFEEMRRDLEGR